MRRPGDGAQLEHRLGTVDHEARMHLDGDLDAVIGGELRVLRPIGRHHFVPLPLENLEIVGRPRAGDPVGPFGVRRIARAAAEIDHHRHAELLRQQDRLPAGFLVVLRALLVGMQRIAVAAQRADAEAVIGQLLLEVVQFARVVEHREFAVGVARIVSGAQFHGIDVVALQFLENVFQRTIATTGG